MRSSRVSVKEALRHASSSEDVPGGMRYVIQILSAHETYVSRGGWRRSPDLRRSRGMMKQGFPQNKILIPLFSTVFVRSLGEGLLA